jgi:hypothetical protein
MSRPSVLARTAGFFYLLVFVAGTPVLAVRKLIVSGDAAATAANILAHQPVFWSGFVSQLVVIGCYIAVTALFYFLFQPASRVLSLMAAFFSLVGSATQVVASIFYMAILSVLVAATHTNVIWGTASQAVAVLFLRLYTQSYDVGLVFFGLYCCSIGCLILRSTFLSRIPGVLMLVAGLGWLTFIAPPFAQSLQPWILVPGIVGEGVLTLWLLIFGVNDERWRAQALARAPR